MDYEGWQMKRKELMDKEKSERSINWQQSRAPIQAAITEQAVRELYDLIDELKTKVEKLVSQTSGVVRK